MIKERLIPACLFLFAEGGDGSSAGTSDAAAEANGNAGGKLINPITGREVRGDLASTLTNAKESATSETEESGDANTDGDAHHQVNDAEDRRKAFQDLVKGEYKDIYTEETQKIIDKRFKQTKELEASQAKSQTLYEALAIKYGLEANDIDGIIQAVNNDNDTWQEKAEEEGMTVDQYKEWRKLQADSAELHRQEAERSNQERANALVAQWMSEAEELKKTFPQFDLNKEAEDPRFLSLLRSNVPVADAFKVIHMDDIVTQSMQATAQAAEKRAVDNVRARGARPAENGSTSRSAFVVKNDVHQLTRADRAEIARRAMRGEQIEF